MKRIAIIGCGGSGKSTVARRMGTTLNLPVCHLDRWYWKPGWIPTSHDEWAVPRRGPSNHRFCHEALSVLRHLEQLRPLTGRSEWVSGSSRNGGAFITAVQKTAERLARETEVAFVSHDLRRTAASCMTSMGISRLVVSKILNHVESGITAVYDRHSYDAEKRQALVQWAARLDSILGH